MDCFHNGNPANTHSVNSVLGTITDAHTIDTTFPNTADPKPDIANPSSKDNLEGTDNTATNIEEETEVNVDLDTFIEGPKLNSLTPDPRNNISNNNVFETDIKLTNKYNYHIRDAASHVLNYRFFNVWLTRLSLVSHGTLTEF